jgi:hypothetical protein
LAASEELEQRKRCKAKSKRRAHDPLKGDHPEKTRKNRARERAIERSKVDERKMAPWKGTPQEINAARMMQAAFRGMKVRRVSKAVYVTISCKLYYAMGACRQRPTLRRQVHSQSLVRCASSCHLLLVFESLARFLRMYAVDEHDEEDARGARLATLEAASSVPNPVRTLWR